MPDHRDAPNPSLLARHRRSGGAHVRYRRVTGVHRAEGLAGPTRRYLFTVALLAGTSSMPIIAAISTGSATVVEERSAAEVLPFVVPVPPDPVVVVPLPATGGPKAAPVPAGSGPQLVPTQAWRGGTYLRSGAGRGTAGTRPAGPGATPSPTKPGRPPVVPTPTPSADPGTPSPSPTSPPHTTPGSPDPSATPTAPASPTVTPRPTGSPRPSVTPRPTGPPAPSGSPAPDPARPVGG